MNRIRYLSPKSPFSERGLAIAALKRGFVIAVLKSVRLITFSDDELIITSLMDVPEYEPDTLPSDNHSNALYCSLN